MDWLQIGGLPERVCIVGLGLMGGSLAMALRGRISTIIGVDANAHTRQMALEQQIVHQATADFAEGIRHADLLILATPVRSILQLLAELPRLRPNGCLVLDIGSTKQVICDAMAALPDSFQAIGGHPMCGRETAGLAAAMADLYQGQTFILCRHARTTAAVEAVALNLIATIGGRPLFLSPQDHDVAVAAVSHLPYLVAAALMGQSDEKHWPVSASGFRDTTRLAGTDPRMIFDVLMTNREAVLDALQAYQAEVGQVIELLAADETALLEWVQNVNGRYQDYRRQRA